MNKKVILTVFVGVVSVAVALFFGRSSQAICLTGNCRGTGGEIYAIENIAVTNITATSATVSWQVNGPTWISRLRHRSGSAYTSFSTNINDYPKTTSTGSTSRSVNLTGLTRSTTYFFQIIQYTGSGANMNGDAGSFRTKECGSTTSCQDGNVCSTENTCIVGCTDNDLLDFNTKGRTARGSAVQEDRCQPDKKTVVEGYCGSTGLIAIQEFDCTTGSPRGYCLDGKCIADTTAPGAVTGFNATEEDQRVVLRWTNPGGDFYKTVVRRVQGSCPSPFTTTTGSEIYNDAGNTKIDTGLNNGTIYCYKAFAYDAARNYNTQTPPVPATPRDNRPPAFTSTTGGRSPNPRHDGITRNSVGIYWTVDENATAQVQFKEDGVWENKGTTVSSVANLEAQKGIGPGLRNGTDYTYRVVARDAVGNEGISNENTFQTTAVCVDSDSGASDKLAVGGFAQYGQQTPLRDECFTEPAKINKIKEATCNANKPEYAPADTGMTDPRQETDCGSGRICRLDHNSNPSNLARCVFCNFNNNCDANENNDGCPEDCPCDGDGTCNYVTGSGEPGEGSRWCPSDCPCNGNGRCDPGEDFRWCYIPDTAECPIPCWDSDGADITRVGNVTVRNRANEVTATNPDVCADPSDPFGKVVKEQTCTLDNSASAEEQPVCEGEKVCFEGRCVQPTCAAIGADAGTSGGKDYYVSGGVKITRPDASGTPREITITPALEDVCVDNITLAEFYCDPARPGRYIREEFRCERGCDAATKACKLTGPRITGPTGPQVIRQALMCRRASCGDGHVLKGVEQCDNGALNGRRCLPEYGRSCTYCTTACKIAVVSGGYCGDGSLQGATSYPPGPEDCEGITGLSNYICVSTLLADQSLGVIRVNVAPYFGVKCGTQCTRYCIDANGNPDQNSRVCFNSPGGLNTDRNLSPSDLINDSCDPDKDNDGSPATADCDDLNSNIKPSATDATMNGIDEDCDGVDGR